MRPIIENYVCLDCSEMPFLVSVYIAKSTHPKMFAATRNVIC